MPKQKVLKYRRLKNLKQKAKKLASWQADTRALMDELDNKQKDSAKLHNQLAVLEEEQTATRAQFIGVSDDTETKALNASLVKNNAAIAVLKPKIDSVDALISALLDNIRDCEVRIATETLRSERIKANISAV